MKRISICIVVLIAVGCDRRKSVHQANEVAVASPSTDAQRQRLAPHPEPSTPTTPQPMPAQPMPPEQASPSPSSPAAIPPPSSDLTTASPSEGEAATEAADTPLAEPTGIEPSASEDRHGQSYRMLLPTSAGLLIADVEITVNRMPIQEYFSSQIHQLLTRASPSKDRTTWDELFQYVASKPARFGRAFQVTPSQYRQLISRYDHDRDRFPDEREVAKFLFRSSPSSLPFRLSGTDRYRGTNRSESSIFKVLDSNHDRALDRLEIEQSVVRLRTLDRNADRRLDVNELDRDPNDSTEAWQSGRSKRWGQVAMDLAGPTDWSMLSYMLGSFGDQGPFGQLDQHMDTLDIDKDGSLDQDEARRLAEISPDLRLRIGYQSGEQESIAVDFISAEIEPLIEVRESPAQIELIGKRFSLVCRLQRSITQSSLFSDQAFTSLDGNQDGFLDPNEISAPLLQGYSFEDFDSNLDAKLSLDEIRTGWMRNEPFWFVQVRARAAESPEAIFRWLDRDADGMLSTREIEGVPAMLRDAAIDDMIRPTDIPDTYLVQFGRGDPTLDAQLFSPNSEASGTTDTRPRWAQAMDFNRDGDIARDEFTGAREQFETFDQNGDGFLDRQEITPIQHQTSAH